MVAKNIVLWLRQWPVIDWMCVAAVCLVNTGILITITILHPAKYPAWTIIPTAILLAIAFSAGFFRLWRPSKVTKQDVLRASVVLLIGCAFVVFALGGLGQLKYIDMKKLSDLGFLGSIGLAASYGGLWSFIRIAAYRITGRADFNRTD